MCANRIRAHKSVNKFRLTAPIGMSIFAWTKAETVQNVGILYGFFGFASIFVTVAFIVVQMERM